MLIYGSACSGIESATVAWHPLAWHPAFFAEIEAFPNAVLAHHYPGVPNLGDITRFKEWPDAALDVLVGGTPCQSFSVAGLRAGLDDPRGNLMLTYLAIAERYRPAWLVWENVPGALSSGGGRDFGVFLWALGKLGYGWAYRVLDAQYFELAQRRARVFVVASARGWASAAAVLFERASLSGNPAPSREAREDIAGTLTRSALNGSGACGGDGRDSFLISHALRAHGFDASEDGSGRGTPLVPVVSPALKARDHKGPSSDGDGDGAPLIPICFDETQITSAENRCNPQPGDPSHPLAAAAAAAARPPTIAFDCKASGRNGFGVGPISPTLRAMGHKDTHSNAGGQVAIAFQTRIARNGRGQPSEIAPALNSADAGATSDMRPCVATPSAVRRLTPRECERLQGFADDYTLVPYRGKLAADGPRYKALGNSMAVPCVRWIGRRIAAVEAIRVQRG